MPKYKMMPNVGPHFHEDKWYHPGDIIDCEWESSPTPKFVPVEVKESPELQVGGAGGTEEIKDQLTGLVKEEVEGGVNVVNPGSGKVLNVAPLSNEQADGLLRKEKNG